MWTLHRDLSDTDWNIWWGCVEFFCVLDNIESIMADFAYFYFYFFKSEESDSTNFRTKEKGKWKAWYTNHFQALRHGSHSFTSNKHHACLYAFTIWRLHRLRRRTSNCSSLFIYRPQKDERLSWPSWLIFSGQFTHIVVTHQLKVERRTGSVRRPKTDIPPTVLRNQPMPVQSGRQATYQRKLVHLNIQSFNVHVRHARCTSATLLETELQKCSQPSQLVLAIRI